MLFKQNRHSDARKKWIMHSSELAISQLCYKCFFHNSSAVAIQNMLFTQIMWHYDGFTDPASWTTHRVIRTTPIKSSSVYPPFLPSVQYVFWFLFLALCFHSALVFSSLNIALGLCFVQPFVLLLCFWVFALLGFCRVMVFGISAQLLKFGFCFSNPASLPCVSGLGSSPPLKIVTECDMVLSNKPAKYEVVSLGRLQRIANNMQIDRQFSSCQKLRQAG